MPRKPPLEVTPEEARDLRTLNEEIAGLAKKVVRGRKQAAASKPAQPCKVRSLDDVIAEFRKLFSHEGIEGVYGFVINVKTAKSRLQLKWGDTRSPLRSKG